MHIPFYKTQHWTKYHVKYLPIYYSCLQKLIRFWENTENIRQAVLCIGVMSYRDRDSRAICFPFPIAVNSTNYT